MLDFASYKNHKLDMARSKYVQEIRDIEKYCEAEYLRECGRQNILECDKAFEMEYGGRPIVRARTYNTVHIGQELLSWRGDPQDPRQPVYMRGSRIFQENCTIKWHYPAEIIEHYLRIKKFTSISRPEIKEMLSKCVNHFGHRLHTTRHLNDYFAYSYRNLWINGKSRWRP